MKLTGWILVVLFSALPAWCAKKITVEQLKGELTSLQRARKTDADVVTALEQLELREQLTRTTMHELEALLPGPKAQRQLRCLAVQSAVLSPPAAEIPNLPPPDFAAQKGILAKTVQYVRNVYMHNPHLLASKTTTTYGEAIRSLTRADLSVTNNLRDIPMQMGELTTHAAEVESENGIEKTQPAQAAKTVVTDPILSRSATGPVLSFILAQAAQGGRLAWLRWEVIHDKPAAVFSFAVDKAMSRYEVNYCCFPALNARKIGRSGRDYEVDLETFKATVPYHGEFFIDPDAGTVLRVITQAELPPSAPVRSEDTRIDYGEISVGGRTLIVPLEADTLVAMVPGAETDEAPYREVHRFAAADYSNYRLATGDKAELLQSGTGSAKSR